MKFGQAVLEGRLVLKNLAEAISLKHVKISHGTLSSLKGVVLLHSTKGAAVVGFESGHGVAFKVLGHGEDGSVKLSAPVPIKLTKLTFGLQLGFNNIDTMLAVFSEATMDSLVGAHNGFIVGKDLDVSSLPDHVPDPNAPTNFHRSSLHAVDNPSEGLAHKAKVITISDSFMLFDFSFYGGSLAVDKDLLASGYGKDAVALDVLNGKVPAPEAHAEDVNAVATVVSKLMAL